MRTLALLAATVLVAANSGAQTPLTIDTGFRFYYTPELMDHWEGAVSTWQPSVANVVLRNDGRVMANGPALTLLSEMLWGSFRSVFMEAGGDGTVAEFGYPCGGHLIEIPETDQYHSGNWRRNYDCTTDFTFGSADFHLNNRSFESWQIFEDRTGLVAGYFRITEEDPLRYVLVKVDQWGEWDSTYTPRSAAGPDIFGKTLFPLNSGQYLFNGNWSSYEGLACNSVIRIGPDGVQDTTFTFRSPYCNLAAIHEQEDGKVILAGQFLLYDYLPDTLNLLRINVDGSLDVSFNNFNQVIVANDTFSTARFAGINVLEALDRGRFVIGGKFTHVSGELRGCIACVDTAGNLLDTWANGGLIPSSYTPFGAPNVGLSGFKRLANGETYLFGQYQGFIDANGSHLRQCLMSRIFMPSVGVPETRPAQGGLEVWPNPGTDQLNVLSPSPVQNAVLEVRNALGCLVLQQLGGPGVVEIDTKALPCGSYMVTLRDQDGVPRCAKWLKL